MTHGQYSGTIGAMEPNIRELRAQFEIMMDEHSDVHDDHGDLHTCVPVNRVYDLLDRIWRHGAE